MESIYIQVVFLSVFWPINSMVMELKTDQHRQNKSMLYQTHYLIDNRTELVLGMVQDSSEASISNLSPKGGTD